MINTINHIFNGEYEASIGLDEELLSGSMPVKKLKLYEKLKDFDFFKTVSIDRGMLVWNNGEIDIAPETLYRDGFAYEVA